MKEFIVGLSPFVALASFVMAAVGAQVSDWNMLAVGLGALSAETVAKKIM